MSRLSLTRQRVRAKLGCDCDNPFRKPHFGLPKSLNQKFLRRRIGGEASCWFNQWDGALNKVRAIDNHGGSARQQSCRNADRIRSACGRNIRPAGRTNPSKHAHF
jgi:hypothetical protein